MKRFIPVLLVLLLLLFLIFYSDSSTEAVQQENKQPAPDKNAKVTSYPDDFNVKLSYDMDHEIDIKEGNFTLSGCYPETSMHVPFTMEDRKLIYSRIMDIGIMDYDWEKEKQYIDDKKMFCIRPTTNSDVYEIQITMDNMTKVIRGDPADCCCLNYYVNGIWNGWKVLERDEINDTTALKFYDVNEALWNLTREIKSMVNSKKAQYNITDPEPIPTCGYI